MPASKEPQNSFNSWNQIHPFKWIINFPDTRDFCRRYLQGGAEGDWGILDVHQDGEDGLGRARVVDHLQRQSSREAHRQRDWEPAWRRRCCPACCPGQCCPKVPPLLSIWRGRSTWICLLIQSGLTQRSKMLKKSPKDWLKIGELFLIETPQLFHLNVLIFKLETIHCSGCPLHHPSFKILNTTSIYIIFFLQTQALPLIIMNHHQNNHSTISYIPPKTQAQHELWFKIQPEPQRLQTSGQAPWKPPGRSQSGTSFRLPTFFLRFWKFGPE